MVFRFMFNVCSLSLMYFVVGFLGIICSKLSSGLLFQFFRCLSLLLISS